MTDSCREKDCADNVPTRPVSSLLSHFEGLAHNISSSAAHSPPDSLLKSPRDEPTRASLDLPTRPVRISSPDSSATHYIHSNGETRRLEPSGSPGTRTRPISMVLQSQQSGLALTVESPQSPPQGATTSLPRARHDVVHEWRSTPQETISVERTSRSQFNRPVSPGTTSSASSDLRRPGYLSPGVSNLQNPSDRKVKSVSLPPPANRAIKPKIPAKPPRLLTQDGGGLAPRPARAASEEKVSPFSTPPESPERSPPKQSLTGRPPSSPLSSPTLSHAKEPLDRRTFGSRSPVANPYALQNTREARLYQDRQDQDFPRDTRPLTAQTPPSQLQQRPRSGTLEKLNASDDPRDRPGLPPRQPFLPPRRNNMSPRRVQHHPDITATHAMRTRRTEVEQHDGERQMMSQTRRQSPRSRDRRTSEVPQYSDLRPPRGPPDEGDHGISETPMRIDYPDASQVNRRPPLFKTGPSEINTRYDTRLLDACGRFVCTTGYLTRVWDVTSGEQIMSLSHGETVKSLSLSFKPGKTLEDEGQRLWLGTSAGELLEVDIQSQSIVATRPYPSRQEVVKILRSKKEMWTIDDEGRLLIWPPDETGTPNLQHSYHSPYERVARGQTFSMVADDTLWLAVGKDVHIYRPNAKDEHLFKVFKRPLGSQHSGEVTSGAYTSKEGGRVYLGHADGKITIYSAAEYSCLAVVNVSVYKINCLGIAGDYLWAGYKTGMIYVYDVKPNPWVVKKDWRAHDSPVSMLLLDASSVWTVDRLQVTSLGTDNCIRLWDGMLEDDWLESQMQSRNAQFCTFREVRAAVLTWNAGASAPSSVRQSRFIEDAIHPEDPPEIVVFGFQELVDLEDKKITAKTLLRGSKKKESGDKEHMSRQYRVWIEHLIRSINDCMPLDETYVLLHTANLVGLFTCVFIKHVERERVRNVSSAEVKRGMGGLHGNKGALVLRFLLDDTSICFVNCHLAAGQTHTVHRNNDIAAILETESLPLESNLIARADRFVGGGDGSMIMDHEICILNGDLNYRIDAIPRNVIIEDIRNNNLAKLLERDQLLASRRKNPGFRLRAFNEAAITFAPTYKYDAGTDEYDSSEKKRSPAWCDRVLYRGPGRVKQTEYRRHEVRASDHRPVSAIFKLRAKTVQSKERAATWEACQQDFQKERQRLAAEASIEYLINVLGTDPHQARSLIFRSDKE